ncbi:MAG: MBL fold metallo-hydrolase [Spirochaetia bacterium]|nr:MBL fold metallo-hydrolase [Spirochaetia bacterium]
MVRQFSVGPIGENVYIVERPGEPVVVVDPGADADRILSETLEAAERVKNRAVHMVCTHGHLDHVAAAPGLLAGLRAAGLEARLFAPAGDRQYFGDTAEAVNRQVFKDIRANAFFTRFWTPIPEADVYYDDGYVFPGTGIRAMHTPGHTPGSSCLLVEGGSILLAGDTLFRYGRGRTDTFDADEAAIVSSIRTRILELPDTVRVMPGHGPSSTIGQERPLYP